LLGTHYYRISSLKKGNAKFVPEEITYFIAKRGIRWHDLGQSGTFCHNVTVSGFIPKVLAGVERHLHLGIGSPLVT
jgi:hypothetical protein